MPPQRARASTLLTLTLLALLAGASVGCQQIRQVSDYFSGNTPGRYARFMEDETSADNRWRGVSGLSGRDFAQRPPYTTRYRQIAENDPDALVRALAVRALNRSRDETATDLYVAALSDPHPLVRLEGAKALAHMPTDAAVEPLRKVVADPAEGKDTRIAAASALKHYKNLEVARTLASLLDERDFAVAWQARRSLRKLTGQDRAYDEGAWLEFITGPEKPLG